MAKRILSKGSVLKWVIYVLIDPQTFRVRYVGWTVNLKKRFNDHKRSALRHRRYRDCWIKSLLRQGIVPISKIVEEGEGESWSSTEQWWIAFYRKIGEPLTNLTDGGEGVTGLKQKPDSIERMRQKKIGIKQTPEQREARARGMRGHIVSQETKRKISEANTGKIRTPEMCERLSKAKKGQPGHKFTPEERRLLSIARKQLYIDHPEKKPTGQGHEDLTGKKFNRLTAVRFVGIKRRNRRDDNNGGIAIWEWLCECGRTKIAGGSYVKTGYAKSCGCLAREILIARNKTGRSKAGQNEREPPRHATGRAETGRAGQG